MMPGCPSVTYKPTVHLISLDTVQSHCSYTEKTHFSTIAIPFSTTWRLNYMLYLVWSEIVVAHFFFDLSF